MPPIAVDQVVHQDFEYSYAKEISSPFGGLQTVLDWCKIELQGEWRWSLIDVSSDQRPGRYRFYFQNERDTVAFTLKWC